MTSVSTLTDLEQQTNSELKRLYCWLQANNLSLNVTRTELLVIGSRQKILVENYDNISIKLQDQVVRKVDHVKSIGVVVDDRLSWSNQVDEILRKVSSAIGVLKRSFSFSSAF